MADRETDDALEEAILAYLHEHPAAMDSLEAVAEWWVMRRVVRVEVEAVQRVLDRLTRSGVLEMISAGGQQCYRLRDG
jgi:Fe2+ or Zn2+ uptake regulation protein